MASLDSIRAAMVNKAKIERDPVKDAEFEKVDSMQQAYYERLRGYKHMKFLSTKPLKYDSSSYRHLLKACVEADQPAIEYSDWVDAHFYWFDKWSGDAPKLWNLSGGSGKMPAQARALEYLKVQDVSCVKPSEPITFAIKTPRAVVDKRNKELLATLKNRFSITDREVYRRFAVPGNNFFDLGWLRRQQEYSAFLSER